MVFVIFLHVKFPLTSNDDNKRIHLYPTSLEHLKRLPSKEKTKKFALIFLPFGVSLYHSIKRQVNGKNYRLNIIYRITVLLDLELGLFFYTLKFQVQQNKVMQYFFLSR